MGSKWRDVRRTTEADQFSQKTTDPRQMDLFPHSPEVLNPERIADGAFAIKEKHGRYPSAMQVNLFTLNYLVKLTDREEYKEFPTGVWWSWNSMRLFEGKDLADGEYVLGLEHDNAFLPLEVE